MEVIVLVGVVFGIVYAFTHRGGTRTDEPDAWLTAGAPATTASASSMTSVTPQLSGPVQLGTQGQAARRLAIIEGRQLAHHEAFVVGIALSITTIVLFGFVWDAGEASTVNTWRYTFGILPAFTLPFAGMTLVAVNMAALRSRRDGTGELFSSLPVNDVARVGGHIGGGWSALVVQAGFVTATAIVGRAVNHHYGAIDAASVGDVAVSFVLVFCAVALGVALARWLPHPLVAFAALVVLAGVGSAIGGIGNHHWSPTRQLSIWPRFPDHDWAFAIRPSWSHALYLLALGVLVTIAAVARRRRDRFVALAAVLAIGVAAVAGWIETRPMGSNDAARIAAMVADPVAHSTCRELGGLRLCAYADYADIVDLWAEQLSQPFAAVPAERRAAEFSIIWRETSLDRLDPAVQRRLDIEALTTDWASDHSSFNGAAGDGTDAMEMNRLAIGLWAVVLPTQPVDDTPCAVGGQARGVVALWVAAQGKSTRDARSFLDGSWSEIDNLDLDIPDSWRGGYLWNVDQTPPVLWSPTDIAAARAVVELDPSAVRELLWSDWTRWTDPATTTDELLIAMHLDPVGAPQTSPLGIVSC